MTEKEIQDRVVAYRMLEARLSSILKQREMITNKIIEIQTTAESINDIVNSKEEILFPIGSEAYAFGKATEKGKIIVEVGANIALEKTIEEGKKILSERQKELESFLQEIQKNISDMSLSMESLQNEIQYLADSHDHHTHDHAG